MESLRQLGALLWKNILKRVRTPVSTSKRIDRKRRLWIIRSTSTKHQPQNLHKLPQMYPKLTLNLPQPNSKTKIIMSHWTLNPAWNLPRTLSQFLSQTYITQKLSQTDFTPNQLLSKQMLSLPQLYPKPTLNFTRNLRTQSEPYSTLWTWPKPTLKRTSNLSESWTEQILPCLDLIG